MNIYSFGSNSYQIRREIYQNRQHIIIPVVMMVEGVHAGSDGPLLHTAEELGHFPASWNGIPVVIRHPQCNGTYVSANSPSVIDNYAVGRVFNTHMDDGKLKAEAWIDETACNEISAEILALINANENIEVSVGVFTDNDEVSGEFNGESYVAIARNHRPDHLALLPDEVGACSWEDGCGVRVNNKGGVDDVQGKEKEVNKFLDMQVNSQSYQEVMSKIQTKLDGMDNDSKFHFLVDVYNDYFVYGVRNRDQFNGELVLYRRNYTVTDKGVLEFNGSAEKVQRTVEYVTTNSAKEEISNMADEKKEKNCKTCPKKVELLIQSAIAPYQEKDREFLMGLDEDRLDQLVTMNDDILQANRKVEEIKPVELTKEQMLTTLSGKLSADEFKALMPAEMKEQMESGLRLHQAHRNDLIAKITVNSKSFTEDELKEMPLVQLEKTASLIATPIADFSGLGGGSASLNTNAQITESDVLLPCGVELSK
jgi:hypothetical protein